MKRMLCALLSLVLCLVLVPSGSAPMRATALSAKACVVMEAQTGKLLYAENESQKRSIASTTKIMTTLLCLESGNLDDPFVVDADAIHVEGSSMGLTEGDVVTKRMLCYGMLLPSGNDAANATAVKLAGSIPAFAERMNARAAQIGMTHSCFVTPSGLEAPGHGASAYDMALLARTALQNPDFREICKQSTAQVEFGNPPYARWLKNTNKLLTMYDGTIGVKTGFTDEAGRCLISACVREGVTLICVTLGAPDDYNDHIALYDRHFARMQTMNLAIPEQMTVPVVGGGAESISVRAGEPVTVGTDNGDIRPVTVRIFLPPFLYAPVEAGEEIGSLSYYYEGRWVADVPLYAGKAAA